MNQGFQRYGVAAAGLPEARRVAYGIVLWQAMATAVIAVLCYFLFGAKAGFSAALGGGIVTVASLVLALVAFRGAEQSMPAMLSAFYIGEAAKIAVVVILFVLVLTTMKERLVPGALFGAYAATFFVHWVGLGRALPRLRGPLS